MPDAEEEQNDIVDGQTPAPLIQEVMLGKREYDAEDADTDEDGDSDEEGVDKFPSQEPSFMSESDLFGRQISADWSLDIGFQRQHTEDPVALCVRQMRVKNTFITIDEDESSQVGETKPRRRRARSAPVMRTKADTTPTSKPAPELPLPTTTSSMTNQVVDTGTTQPPLDEASEGPSADSVSVNDLGMMLPCLPRPSTPPRRPFHHVEHSSGPTLSTPSLVASASLSQAGGMDPLKCCPVRIDGLGDWPSTQAMPYFAKEPECLDEPHFVQPRWDPRGPRSDLEWPGNFVLDYSMRQKP